MNSWRDPAARIDLHAHTLCSDGTRTPAQLVADARAAGLDAVAITDHDSTSGWVEASAAVLAGQGEQPLALVRGVEISCALPVDPERLRAMGQHVPTGVHPVLSVHLLCYLHDPEDPALAATLAAARTSRAGRARAMVERISADYPLAWADVEAEIDRLSGDGTIGRPHIADALVRRGIASDRADAFVRILHPGGPYFVRHAAPHPVEAITMVRAAGGVPVFAHPAAITRGMIVDDDVIDAMAAAGLGGLEVWHRDNDQAAQERLVAIADRLGLFVTGASDYHGAGKPNRLGEHTTTARVMGLIAAEGKLQVIE